jgi:hypothetical protein
MAFDSTLGAPTQNAYVAEAIVDAHHTDRNNTAWFDFTSPEKQAAIIRASDYVDKRFGRRFRGVRRTVDQGLEWPRIDATDEDGYALPDNPAQLQKAIAEYALRAAICGVLAPDPTLPVPKQSFESGNLERVQEPSGEITRRLEKVGPIQEETYYRSPSSAATSNISAGAREVQTLMVNDYIIPEYPEADLWLEELLRSSGSVRLARA